MDSKDHTVIETAWLTVLKMLNVFSLHACFLLKIFVNFAVLAPKEELQMEVVMSLITATMSMKQMILQHPLVEMYLCVKWSKLRIYFYSLLFVHALLVFSLSGYSITILQPEINSILWNGILGFSSCLLLFCNPVMQVLMISRFVCD